MRHQRTIIGVAILAAVAVVPGHLKAQDAARAVSGGGISVPGWQGKIDASEIAAGRTLNDAKLSGSTAALQVTTGPAVVYWHPDNKVTGDYTVKATFTEAKYMNLNNHPHPYGIVIGGNDMGTDNQSYLYCATYGNGSFILRGFGPQPFRVNGNRAEANAAINKAAGAGASVTQDVAVSVKGDKVECSVNGTVVGSYNKADVVAAGKLKSTDGVYGVRFGHNTEATVTGLTVSNP
ncbi:MAG TPA: hypothetical protein VEB19_11520 [Gemmatimonadaceae bacterium]|nr:hypothetical protein [Gemmatimonadaceae bacterium]